MRVVDILKEASRKGASDCYIICGAPVTFKVFGRFVIFEENVSTGSEIETWVQELYEIGECENKLVFNTGDDDFGVTIPNVSRFRVNVFRQSGTLAVVIRVIPYGVPDPKKFNIPKTILDFSKLMRGIVLVTGTTGSGKSTTLACLIDLINSTRENHIITIEDPVEFVYSHKKSLISQREVRRDTEGYGIALRAAMRQVPDVILLGEMRDYDTISAAITAAETGHLVFSTLHTMGAGQTIDRVIDVFPASQQNQIRTQLAATLQAVVCQQLIPTKDRKLFPAFEIMIATTAIKTLIREGKVHQIPSIIDTSKNIGMCSMDSSLFNMYVKGVITQEVLLTHSIDPSLLMDRIKQGR